MRFTVFVSTLATNSSRFAPLPFAPLPFTTTTAEGLQFCSMTALTSFTQESSSTFQGRPPSFEEEELPTPISAETAAKTKTML